MDAFQTSLGRRLTQGGWLALVSVVLLSGVALLPGLPHDFPSVSRTSGDLKKKADILISFLESGADVETKKLHIRRLRGLDEIRPVRQALIYFRHKTGIRTPEQTLLIDELTDKLRWLSTLQSRPKRRVLSRHWGIPPPGIDIESAHS